MKPEVVVQITTAIIGPIRSTKISADDVSGAVGEQLDLLSGGGLCVDPDHVLGAAWTHEASPSPHPSHRDAQLCL